ncbi:MAG: hypothetical protein FD170_3997 [Bacteroidetes bacterium]|nr:MAG: hypothetical protein FD170_3997 [Bacteroidota bacterium]
MADRTKIYPTEAELTKLGFKKQGSGEDPRDFWQEIDLSNKEASGNEISLSMDAYFDFSLYIPELMEPIPLNFKSVQEIETFIAVFTRPWNGAFAGLLDISKEG